MLEKLRDNPRVVIAILVTAGILAFAIGNSGNNNGQDTDQTETPAPEVVVNDDEDLATEEGQASDEEADTGQASDETIGSEPEAGIVQVEKEDDIYKATVRKGDNQTIVVRQVINDYMANQTAGLSAEQRLYMETVIVNSLPRNDVVFTGQEITVDEATINNAAEDAKNLTEAQIAQWSMYL